MMLLQGLRSLDVSAMSGRAHAVPQPAAQWEPQGQDQHQLPLLFQTVFRAESLGAALQKHLRRGSPLALQQNTPVLRWGQVSWCEACPHESRAAPSS